MKLALLLILLSLPAQAAPLCTLPSVQFGYYKKFYNTEYSFTYSDASKKLYFVFPNGSYSLYDNISSAFAHSFTYISATPDQFLTQVRQQSNAHSYLLAENCTPLLAENGSNLLAW